MGLIFFELKEDHVKLLRHIKWSLIDNVIISNQKDEDGENSISMFGNSELYETIDLILNGKPADFKPFEIDPISFTVSDVTKIDEGKRVIFDKLLSELPMALEIILYTKTFEPGTYVAKFHDRVWKKKVPTRA